MKLPLQFDACFTPAVLKNTYINNVLLSAATGVDNMTHNILWAILDEQLDIIQRKVFNATYKFNKYKLKLISKGRGKSPREISIPTIRDKIALRALCDFLKLKYADVLDFQLPQDVVKDLKKEIGTGKYTAFVKFDVANFYPSIKHDKLLSRLRMRLRDKRIINLIESAITSPTVFKPSASDKKSSIGVPQGLSISNVLAAVFLSNLDKKIQNNPNIKYYRYVDDVLVLCDVNDMQSIIHDVVKGFKNLGLKVYDPLKYPEKSSYGTLSMKHFDYLGYYFHDNIVSARTASIERLRESLISIFTGYKYSKLKSTTFLEWRVNLRVTGCVFQNKSKGWMFFFSEINNEILLHELDYFLSSLCKRFGVNINLKSFVRTFYQIKHNRHDTKYIPNFDNFTENEMTYVLNFYFNKKTDGLAPLEIEYEFKKRISRQVKELETDVKDAGY